MPNKIKTFADLFPDQVEKRRILDMQSTAQRLQNEADALDAEVRRWLAKSQNLKKRSDGKFDERSSSGRFMNSQFANLRSKAKKAKKEAAFARLAVPDAGRRYRAARRKLIHQLTPPYFFKAFVSCVLLAPVRPTWSLVQFIALTYYTLFSGIYRRRFVRGEIKRLELALGINKKTGSRS